MCSCLCSGKWPITGSAFRARVVGLIEQIDRKLLKVENVVDIDIEGRGYARMAKQPLDRFGH